MSRPKSLCYRINDCKINDCFYSITRGAPLTSISNVCIQLIFQCICFGFDLFRFLGVSFWFVRYLPHFFHNARKTQSLPRKSQKAENCHGRWNKKKQVTEWHDNKRGWCSTRSNHNLQLKYQILLFLRRFHEKKTIFVKFLCSFHHFFYFRFTIFSQYARSNIILQKCLLFCTERNIFLEERKLHSLHKLFLVFYFALKETS